MRTLPESRLDKLEEGAPGDRGFGVRSGIDVGHLQRVHALKTAQMFAHILRVIEVGEGSFFFGQTGA